MDFPLRKFPAEADISETSQSSNIKNIDENDVNKYE